MDEPRRTDVFERELKRALAASGGAAPGAHVDAELAAAWMDRRLDAVEARAIEAHLADCPDCQTLMATLARLAPGAESAGAAPAWWRRLRAGWVVPATVATAAALVIWVVVPEQQRASTPAEQAQAPETAAAELSQARARDAAEPARGAAPPAANAPEADAADARGFAPAAAAVEPQRKAESEAAPARPSAPAPQPPPPPAAPAPSTAPPASADLERRERRADAPAEARPSTLNDSLRLESKQSVQDAQSPKAAVAGEPAVRQEAAAPAAGAAGGASGGVTREGFSQVAGLRAASALAIVAPDGGARWRRTGTVIEFARRANADSTAVTLPVPTSAITAGASPGGTVCWLVGAAGTVLVTDDGVRFTRVTSPASVDFAAVSAADARTAIVTATDGRRFRTTDQGATWVPLP